MDINAAAKEYGNGVITSLKKNRRILIMMLLFAAGMIIGAVSLKRADSYLSGAFSDMFSVYIRSKGSQSLGMNFINSLAVNAAIMLAVFVFGLCAVGLPLICERLSADWPPRLGSRASGRSFSMIWVSRSTFSGSM